MKKGKYIWKMMNGCVNAAPHKCETMDYVFLVRFWTNFYPPASCSVKSKRLLLITCSWFTGKRRLTATIRCCLARVQVKPKMCHNHIWSCLIFAVLLWFDVRVVALHRESASICSSLLAISTLAVHCFTFLWGFLSFLWFYIPEDISLQLCNKVLLELPFLSTLYVQ